MLYHAHAIYKSNICGCGCGQWAPEAHDPLMVDQYVVDDSTVCEAGAVLQQWQKDQGEHTEAGVLPIVRKRSEMADEALARLERNRKAQQAAKSKPATTGKRAAETGLV